MFNKIERLEMHISYSCSNNCIFCSEKESLTKIKDTIIPVNTIFNILKNKREQGFNHLTLTGGEPTLVKDLASIIHYAKKLNYKICLTTNSYNLNQKEFIEDTLNKIDELILSCHGFDDKIHNFHTNNEESFKKIILFLETSMQSKFGNKNLPYIMLNTVVTNYNVTQLGKILDMIIKFKNIKHYIISYPSPEGNAYINYKKIAVNLNLFKKYISKLCKKALKNNISLRFFGIPTCILNPYVNFSNDFYYDPRVTIEWDKFKDSRIFFKEIVSLTPNRKRCYLRNCIRCKYYGKCGGIFEKYLEIFPNSINTFKPIS
jgi:molybdenum cofactor biosynthesis enzyme MoaA